MMTTNLLDENLNSLALLVKHTNWKKGTEFLGSKTAIMAGAMTWVSNHNLVAGVSNAGGFGVLACGSMSADLLAKEIQETRNLTSNPFGVNVIVMHPDLNSLVDVCVIERVSHVVLAGGLPSQKTIDQLHQNDIKVIAFAPSLLVAKRLIRMGVNALVIEGCEAGGHIGPVSTAVLAQEILPHIHEVPVFVAGGIGRGEAIASYLLMGAAGVQLGTRFVCAHESIAHPAFKAAFVKAAARDAIASVQLDSRFPVIPVRALANKASRDFMEFQSQIIKDFDTGILPLKDAQLKIEHFWAGALRRAVINGDIDTGSLMAGQSVGMVEKEQSTAEIITELVNQMLGFLQKRYAA